MERELPRPSPPVTGWSGQIPDHDWSQYRIVLEAVRERRLPFAIGGGFAFSTYARRWRDTKDIDLYILQEHRERFIDVLSRSGFDDYHAREPYDRGWIYRGYRGGVIVDLIWAMANRRAYTDRSWLTRGPEIEVRGISLRILPPEEFLWTKLYVVQRDRCDWPDILNVLAQQGPALDWPHLLARVGEDVALLGAVLNLFGWLCPAQAQRLPEWLWPRVGLLRPAAGLDCDQERRRVTLLDSRDWFGPRPGPSRG